jgi:serine/threonine protein kinase
VVVTLLNGKYVLERRLGGGGMAEVFLARTVGAEGFERKVAVKRVLDELSRDPRFAGLFIAEAQLGARLGHPNLVSVLDFDRDADGRLFLVMELVDGVDLRGLLGTGRLPFSLVIYLATEILRGLDYAHALPVNADGVRGIVHRDISPHNVLLSWEGAVKVADFGIAKAHAATYASGSVLLSGKPAYMSPEQINGRPLDGRSDLFAVGVMMFEMLCAVHPFAGASVQEMLGHVLYGDIPRVRDLRPDVPEDLSSVVASLLARDLGQRMPSAEAALAALVACASCPKAGPEELSGALSQRFTGRAPIRPRNITHGSQPDPRRVARPPPALRVPPAGTSTSGPGATPKPDRRWAILAALVVASSAIGAVLARSGGKPGATAPPAASEPAPREPPEPAAPGRAATTSTVAPPAAVPAAAHGRVDTATPQAPRPRATGSVRDHAHAPAGPGDHPMRSEGIQEIHL